MFRLLMAALFRLGLIVRFGFCVCVECRRRLRRTLSIACLKVGLDVVAVGALGFFLLFFLVFFANFDPKEWKYVDLLATLKEASTGLKWPVGVEWVTHSHRYGGTKKIQEVILNLR